jgi:murein DD-endopeptidase MepM/ murein hydrolase activator NlpD
MSDISSDLQGLESELRKIKGLTQSIGNDFKSWRTPQGGSSGGTGGVGGGSNNIMGNALGRVSQTLTETANSPGAMVTKFGGFLLGPGVGMAGYAATAAAQTVAAGAKLGLGLISANSVGMPGVTDVLDRAQTYYNAGVSSGGFNRAQMEKRVFGTMQGGITSQGSDARTLQFLTAAGMDPNSQLMTETLTGVKNAAKYMNMGNEQAAVALEGLTSGSGASRMLSQYGIFTADMASGKEKTSGQIFGELYGRFTAGQDKMSVEDTMRELRRGALGANIRNSGMSPEQQAMFAQYAINRAKGLNMDLSSDSDMSKIMGDQESLGNANPYQAQMDLISSNTKQQNKAEASYIKGLEDAVKIITPLNEEFGDLAKNFGQLNTLLQVLGSNPAFAGKLQQTEAVAGFAKDATNAWIPGAEMFGLDKIAQSIPFIKTIFDMVGNLGGASSTVGTGSSTGAPNMTFSTPANGRITARYGQKGRIWASGFHKGTDYGVPDGSPVYAAAPGKVVASAEGAGSNSYGKYVRIDHGDGYETLYAHLQGANVYPGDSVKAGQVIAKSGRSGHVSGPHLHFEVFKNKASIDPSGFLSGAVKLTGASVGKSTVEASGGLAEYIGESSLVSTDMAGVQGGSGYSVVEGINKTGFGGSQTGSVATGDDTDTGGTGMGGSSSYISMGGSSSTGGGLQGGGNNVTINLKIDRANEDEARKFAKLVKTYLEEDSHLSGMGRR